MPKNEDGEVEFVLGHKQLLSVFFIVVILLGVFFSMGYFVGRSSNPVGAMETASAKTNPAPSGRPPIVVEPDQAAAAAAKPDEPVSAPAEPAATPPPTVEVTKVTPSTPEPAKPADPKTTATPEKAKPFPTPEPAAAASGEPLPGQSYLQVGAVKKAEADALIEVLRKRGFSATTAPVPGQPLFRVLVGPIKDGTDLAETRNNLESVGFKNAIKRTY